MTKAELTIDTKVQGTDDVVKQVNQFKQLKNSMREAAGELAGLTEGTDEYVKQAKRVGEIKDQIDDLNSAIRNVSGSPVENLSSSFGMLSGQVGNLDFEGAASSLKQFGGQINNLKFGDIAKSAKAFGSTISSVGKSLLTNPLFLIPAIVIAVGLALYALKDKVKIIGAYFDFIGGIIDTAVQALQDFTDFLGLTTFAADALAEHTQKVAEENFKAQTDLSANAIKLAKAQGKDTADLEREDLKRKEQYYTDQINLLKKKYYVEGKINKEEFKKQFDELKTSLTNAKVDQEVLDATIAKKKEDEDKKKADKAKAEREKRNNETLAADAKLAADTLAIKNNVFLQSIKNEEIRANTEAAINKAARDKDALASKAHEDKKKAQLEASELQYQLDLRNIKKTFDEKRKADEEKKLADEKAENEKRKADAKAFSDAALAELVKTEELKVAATAEASQAQLDAKIEQLEVNRDIELLAAEDDEYQKSLIKDKYRLQEEQLNKDFRDKEEEEKKKARDQEFQATQNLFTGLQGISDLFFSVKFANLKKGSAEEEKAARNQFKINKALNLATATINGVQAVISTFAETPGGIIIKSIAAASAGIVAAANIAKIAAVQFESKGGGSAAAAAPEPAKAAPSQPSSSSEPSPSGRAFNPQAISLSGIQNGQQDFNNNVQKARAERVYVLESDIRNAGQRIDLIESRATF